MKGSYYITDRQADFHGGTRPEHRGHRMVVEIPESLFRAINKARGRFSADGVKNAPSLSSAITGLLRAVPKDGEI